MESNLNGRRLFVFDDDPSLVTLIQRIAGQRFPRVFPATSCQRALELVQGEVRDYDLILTDLNFPDGSGLDILRAARQKAPAAAVVILTGFATLESAVQALDEGAFDYITKPFTVEQILATLNKMDAHLQLRHENTTLRARLAQSADRTDRQQARYDELVQEVRRNSQLLQEHQQSLQRIQGALDLLVRTLRPVHPSKP